VKRYEPEMTGPNPDWMSATMEESPDGNYLLRSDVIAAVEAEPEFPDPCPNLRTYIADAVRNNDQEWILHLMRQTVRATKDLIAARLNA
jgi:hypothetical protein